MTIMKMLLIIISVAWMGMAHAFSWQDLWLTKDQQASRMMQKGEFAKAKDTFERADWRATSAYRSGDYEQAASLYKGLDNEDAYYNQANALAHMGKYEEAIKAYDKALTLNPKDEDAAFNRKLLEDMLKKQQQQDQNNQDQQNQDQKDQDKQNQDQKDQDKQNQDQKDQDKQNQDQKDQDQQNQDQKDQDKQNQGQKEKNKQEEDKPDQTPAQSDADRENKQAMDQWLRLIPDDPGGLLREKFLRDHLRRQNGWSQ